MTNAETPMNPEVKASWLAALRSDEYQQTRRRLRRTREELDSADPPGFCCLGVLCDLAVKEGVTTIVREDIDGIVSYARRDGDIWGEAASLPPNVIEWAGLPNSNPDVVVDGSPTCLAAANDEGLSFAQIADLIERQL